MTTELVLLDDLLAIRERILRELHQGLDADERRFLLSLVSGAPEWQLLGGRRAVDDQGDVTEFSQSSHLSQLTF